MKTLLVLITVLASATLSAEVKTNFEGHYMTTRTVKVNGLTKKECIDEDGSYSNGVCLVRGGAEVLIEKDNSGSLKFYYAKLGNNFNVCVYHEGDVEVISKKHLQASDGDNFKCRMNVAFTSSNSISITPVGQCEEYCDVGLVMNEAKLKRIK